MKEWIQINTIEGYEDIKNYYYLSNNDEDIIVNKDTGKQLKSSSDNKSYKIIRLRTNQGKTRTCKIHILKAKAFLFSPNPIGVNVVRHLNDIKTDNRLGNLAWGSYSDNVRDCIRNGNYNYEGSVKGGTIGGKIGGAITAKKVSKPVRCIETGTIYSSALQAEHQLGIARGNISHCCSGKRHTASGFHWEYVNHI